MRTSLILVLGLSMSEVALAGPPRPAPHSTAHATASRYYAYTHRPKPILKRPGDRFAGPSGVTGCRSGRCTPPPRPTIRPPVHVVSPTHERSVRIERHAIRCEADAAERGLQLAGYDVVVDCHLSEVERSEIRDFQRRHGLAVDGVPGPRTLAALLR